MTTNRRFTPFAKGVFTCLIAAGVFFTVQHEKPELFRSLFPQRAIRASSIPLRAELPGLDDSANATTTTGELRMPGTQPGCPALPAVTLDLWAWNAQSGAMFANGGARSTEGSLMCDHGVNLRFVRQDDPAKMRTDLVTFATRLKAGEAQPRDGAAFVAIMGDGAAVFLAELDPVLAKLGPEYRAKVVGSMGYSWGEDKFMGPPAWKQTPARSKGGLVAGVLRDGDWNIAQKWLAENQLCNNPDEHTWDPECLNWMGTPGYVEAAQQYVAGACESRPVVQKGKLTGETRRVCVDGVVTWTPGDVTVARERGGLVSIASTREYRGQMPNVVIGIDRWMKENRSTTEGMLAAMFEGGDAVKRHPKALQRASAISARVYGEEDAKYWETYFHGVTETDRQGLKVELGGSRVNNLADNAHLFGLADFAPGSVNLFEATYTVFGRVAVDQYPDIVPSFPPAWQITDTSYLEAIARKSANGGDADLVRFSATAPVRDVVSRGSWAIGFKTGSAQFTPGAQKQLDALFEQLLIAGGTAVEVHGHTDAAGDAKANLSLSEARAFAVKHWLETKSAASFPEGRVRVFAHGQENPAAPNSTAEGRALNRRVEIVLGTTS